jgi:ferrochelatase
MRTAVVLLQLGGPDALDAVEPFLYNLFIDPDIIDLPGAFLFRKGLARLISRRRAPKIQELYKDIGGRSPILEQTQTQVRALRASLGSNGFTGDVFMAMRYWHPMTDAAVQKIADGRYDRVVLLPLYPHYCRATTGSSVNEWNRTVKRLRLTVPTQLVREYHDHPMYIDALVDNVNATLERFDPAERHHVHLLFSAHGTPMKLVREGDPYSHQIRRTYGLVVERGGWGLPHHLCFQSKVGPQKWLEPSLTKTIDDLANEGARHLLVVPIAFVSEHIETLSEINIEARRQAHALGIKRFEMMPALIDHPKFISCLTELVRAGGERLS